MLSSNDRAERLEREQQNQQMPSLRFTQLGEANRQHDSVAGIES
jgi:hypothetical protein